jgi:hypothetical protein
MPDLSVLDMTEDLPTTNINAVGARILILVALNFKLVLKPEV